MKHDTQLWLGQLGGYALIVLGIAVMLSPLWLTFHTESYSNSVSVDVGVTGTGDYVLVGQVTPHKPYDGWEVFVFDGHPCLAVMRDFPDEQLRVCAKTSILGSRHIVQVDWSGLKAQDTRIYVDGEEQPLTAMSDTLSSYPVASQHLSVGYRYGQEGLEFEGNIYKLDVCVTPMQCAQGE